MHFVVAAFLAFLLVVTIAREVKKFETFFLKYFPLLMQFIPIWSFFAPIPNMNDFHLLYRGLKKNGDLQEWQPAITLKEKRPFYTCLWNKEKRFQKAILDFTLDLLQVSQQFKDKTQICSSIPYLQILNFVDSLTHCKNVEKIQFVILSNSRLKDFDMEFLSEFHPLAPISL
jgi:hypothetical protein